MTNAEVQPTTKLPSGDPVPAADVAPPAPPRGPSTLQALLSSGTAGADAFLGHLQRCLSTPAGVDTVLLFACYGARLSAASLELLTRPVVRRRSRALLALAAALPPKSIIVFANGAAGPLVPSPVALMLSLARRLKNLSVLISDVRTFSRLWGLLGMYFWARGLFTKLQEARAAAKPAADGEKTEAEVPKVDKLEMTLAVGQLVACILFQTLENAAYLASKGVLEWEPARIGKAGRWSSRFWGSFVGLKLGELLLSAYRRSQVPARERMGDKTVSVFESEERAWNEDWRKQLSRQMAWFPLTIHWGLEQGLVSEWSVGALGSIPGIIQFRDLWAKTA
jgi:hypothetical protein